jgi:hypothetical protein
MTFRAGIRFATIFCALLLGACSSFDRQWKSAAHARTADPFSGAWDGKWTTEKHRQPSGASGGGRLRCIFTKIDATHYQAKFYANWLIFAGGYDVTFLTERRGNELLFRGEHDLGAIFGGVYRYAGRATPDHFRSTFASHSDRGVFEMTRPAR